MVAPSLTLQNHRKPSLTAPAVCRHARKHPRHFAAAAAAQSPRIGRPQCATEKPTRCPVPARLCAIIAEDPPKVQASCRRPASSRSRGSSSGTPYKIKSRLISPAIVSQSGASCASLCITICFLLSTLKLAAPEARSPKPEARSPKPEARSPKPEARSPKPEAPSRLRTMP